METENYKDLLQSVGIETFVEYYDVFKAHCFEQSNVQVVESFSENKETWNKDLADIKANKGKKIFSKGREIYALLYIIHEASEVDDKIKEKAEKLLFDEEYTINGKEYKVLFKDDVQYSSEFKEVEEYARQLNNFLKKSENRKNIAIKHRLSTNSGEIQEIILPKVQEFGFESEKQGLFEEDQLRPDFYKKLNGNTGIIIEVEHNKTLTNNMDLLDVWKCHICKEANYLFLIVPAFQQNKEGKSTPTYIKVVERLQPFFLKENYINVDAVFIFGY
jgi:hypothetical protein